MIDFTIFTGLKEKELKSKEILIGEGRYIVERMIKSNLKMVGMICTPSLFEYFNELLNNRCPIVVMDTNKIAELIGYQFHRGVIAAAQRPPLLSLKHYLEDNPDVFKLLLLPAIVEMENLGNIIRSAAAFNMNLAGIGTGCCDPFSRKVIRCSMGAVFTFPIVSLDQNNEIISILKNNSFQIIGASTAETAIPIEKFNFHEKTALVFGNESSGLNRFWLDACDVLVTIPFNNAIDSLNVNVAAGIFFHALYSGKR